MILCFVNAFSKDFFKLKTMFPSLVMPFDMLHFSSYVLCFSSRFYSDVAVSRNLDHPIINIKIFLKEGHFVWNLCLQNFNPLHCLSKMTWAKQFLICSHYRLIYCPDRPLVHDVINLLCYEHWTDKQKYFFVFQSWLRYAESQVIGRMNNLQSINSTHISKSAYNPFTASK